MKSLYLVRHADAESPRFGSDFERKLTTYGEQRAAALGYFLQKRGISPQLVISSDAIRAAMTAQIIADVLQIAQPVKLENKIYNASESQLLDYLMMAEVEVADSILLVGHNPTLSQFVYSQAGKPGRSMQTASVVGLTYNIGNWSEISAEQCQFLFYESPA